MKINEAVRQMYPPRYTVQQAAALVGRSVDTLKRWQKTGVYAPSDENAEHFGKLRVPLYTDDDIKKMRQVAREQKPGRKAS